ncbi:hypothetical protein DPEC_G00173280 [Dallia pectoralis]|uniref:Uncharacterized protein n=1 Tax=Dallia pectoralis TaxID=75939 RepID=A0ACC2GDS8_DALPE|nr:hypothetical protein DPEC_G00173280 [Dallia pectoralis]
MHKTPPPFCETPSITGAGSDGGEERRELSSLLVTLTCNHRGHRGRQVHRTLARGARLLPISSGDFLLSVASIDAPPSAGQRTGLCHLSVVHFAGAGGVFGRRPVRRLRPAK